MMCKLAERIVPVIFAISFAAATAGAQAVEVVPMAEEPFHRRVLKNDAIDVFEVKLPVGATMKYHTHPTDHFAVVVRPGLMKNETVSGRIITNPPIDPGSIVFLPAGDSHRQTNADKGEVHFVAVELLGTGNEDARPATKSDGCRSLVFENARIAAYSCTLKPGESTVSIRSDRPFLRVFITNATVASGKQAIKQGKLSGSADWFDSPGTSLIRNAGRSEIHVVEIELK